MPDELLRRWAETWQRAGEELDRLWREELETVDTQEAVRQIFGGELALPPPEPTSGLIEQQAWFRRLYDRNRKTGQPGQVGEETKR